MAKYIKCRPTMIYTIKINDKVIYEGEDKKIAQALRDSFLETKKRDFYYLETKRRRYMLLDDEQEQEMKEQGTQDYEERTN